MATESTVVGVRVDTETKQQIVELAKLLNVPEATAIKRAIWLTRAIEQELAVSEAVFVTTETDLGETVVTPLTSYIRRVAEKYVMVK
jgi:predicted transcriptional regulator